MRTALQVRQTYCDTHLDLQHFRSGRVGIGSRVSWKWRFLGVDMGTVPAVMRHVLPWLPPIWSEVEPVQSTHFQTDDETDLETLFLHTDDGWTVQVPEGWSAEREGEPFTGIQARSLMAPGCKAQAADDSGRGDFCRKGIRVDGPLTLRHGDLTFEADLVEAPTAPKRSLPDPEPPILASFAMMGATGLLFGLGVYFAPPPAQVSVLEIQERVAQIAMVVPPPEEPKPLSEATEPAAGSPGPKSEDPTPEPAGSSRERDIQVASSAGIFSGMDALGDWDSADLGGIADAAGDLIASSSGRGPAIGGLNGRGGSLGGGGDGEGIDMPGRGPGGNQFGYDGGNLTGKRGGGPITIAKDPLVIGSVDAEDIDRVIKNHLSQIRYCYQRQLPRNPDLSGKLVVKFSIAKDGSVSSASVKSTTLGDPAVGQCVVGRIQRMQFVTPKGGGIAIVSYPFMFSPG